MHRVALLSSHAASRSISHKTMSNKIFCITGANQGIGLEFARQIKEKGHTVYGSYRKDEGGLAEIGAVGIGGIELTEQADLDKLATAIPDPVDYLLLNAAIFPKEGCDSVSEGLNKELMMKV